MQQFRPVAGTWWYRFRCTGGSGTTAPSPSAARRRAGFGHYGFGGSGAWADPDRQLAVALVLNSAIGTPFDGLRTVAIGGVALQCAIRADKQR